MSAIKPAVHYNNSHGTPGLSACGLRMAAEKLTADLDAVTCGKCMSGVRWRNDMSQRLYKGDYERFYGPGGFLDRAGQTTPASATAAPQARAALEKQIEDETGKVAALGSRGAGSDVIARAVREAVRTVMLGADACIRITAGEVDERGRRQEPPASLPAGDAADERPDQITKALDVISMYAERADLEHRPDGDVVAESARDVPRLVNAVHLMLRLYGRYVTTEDHAAILAALTGRENDDG